MRKLLLCLALLAFAGSADAATSFTANVCAPKPTPGDPSSQSTWGTLLNTGFDIFDGITSGVSSISVAGSSNVVLTFSCGTLDQTDAQHFTFTGLLTGNINVLWPNGRTREFSVTNSTTGSFTLSLGVNNGAGSPAGTVQAIAQGSAGRYFSDGTNVNVAVQSGLVNLTQQRFSGSGTYTPTLGTKFVKVMEAGGGGMGGDPGVGMGGGGGGAGECAQGIFTAAQIGSSQTITIGAGSSSPVGSGGTTRFGTLLTALGAASGAAGQGGLGGLGGTGTGLHTAGGDGANGFVVSPSGAGTQLIGGQGGGSCFGGGGAGSGYNGSQFFGFAGRAPGAGGGGGSEADAGGVGANGEVVIDEYQ